MQIIRHIFLIILCLLFHSCSNENNSSFILLSHNNLTFDWTSNQTKIIEISTNTQWSISSLPDWLSLEYIDQKNGKTLLHITTTATNETDSSRSCNIFISSQYETATLFVTQKAKEKLSFTQKGYKINFSKQELVIDIQRNVQFLIQISEDWINLKNQNDLLGSIYVSPSITFDINENYNQTPRTANVIISNQAYNLSDTLTIIQAGNPNEYYCDGSYIQLQKATKGNGVNLIFMGDGFTKEHLAINGKYEETMKKATEYFFSIEPFNSYRDFFNVYMVAAESEEEGVNNENGNRQVNNKFQSTFGNGTAISCNDDLCFEYARKIKELPFDSPITIIMPLNSNKYAGTTYLYSNGNSIALCPMSTEESPNDFEGLIHHEAGGHGFGFLCDEYVYYDRFIPETRKQEIREWQQLGFQMNLDFTKNLSDILWKDFIGIEKYSEVGAYEGGYEYQYGIWRPEENSCMNDNIPYFNVQSRWYIARRIMHLAGNSMFSIDDFIKNDSPAYHAPSRSVSKRMQPLGEPVWIK